MSLPREVPKLDGAGDASSAIIWPSPDWLFGCLFFHFLFSMLHFWLLLLLLLELLFLLLWLLWVPSWAVNWDF
jgi:hypothetical protein